MTTTKPSAGAMKAAVLINKTFEDTHGLQLNRNIVAEVIDHESGLAELLKCLEILDDIISIDQPGMPPLPHQWSELFRRHIFTARNKAEKGQS